MKKFKNHLDNENYDIESNDSRIFHKLYIKLFPTFKTLCLSRFFFLNFYFENLCFQLPNKNGDLSFLLYLPKQTLIGNIKEKIEKNRQIIFIFLGITLIGQNEKILTAVNIDSSQSDYFGRLLLIFSRHSLIIILFTKIVMRHQE